MSYRELRCFTETLRALRYPRIVSMENFRQPNFELVADILYWMVCRLDSEIPVHSAIGTEEERAQFLNSIGKALYERAGIKLNLIKLYSADGYAVKELLKIARVLHNALQEAEKYLEHGSTKREEITFAIPIKDAKRARNLASTITESAAALHDMLKRELECNETRSKNLKLLDSQISQEGGGVNIEKKLSNMMNSLKEEVGVLEHELTNLSEQETHLQESLKKKTIEYERNQKRFESLKTVRPGFMDEYDRLETDLQDLFDLYLERKRNVHHMKNEIKKYEKLENEQFLEIDRMMKRTQNKLRKQELEVLRGDEEVTDIMENDLERANDQSQDEQQSKLKLSKNETSSDLSPTHNQNDNTLDNDSSIMSEINTTNSAQQNDSSDISSGSFNIDDSVDIGDSSRNSDDRSPDQFPDAEDNDSDDNF